jgi:hypothetical protein
MVDIFLRLQKNYSRAVKFFNIKLLNLRRAQNDSEYLRELMTNNFMLEPLC